MKNNLFTKIITLSFFICCIVVFVMQQSGYFNGSKKTAALQSSHNGGVLTGSASCNEMQKKRDSVKFQILRSSKSLVIDDEKLQQMIDHKLGITPESIDTTENKIFSSSKVLIITPPQVKDKPIADTLKSFTPKPKK